jgi:hypothetical protein
LLLPLLGRKKTDALLNGFMPRYELPAALTIKSFSSLVECDQRSYTAEVASIRPVSSEVIAVPKPSLMGC